ncbi:BrnA antitoxin family protein [Neisseriaceae bacterium ESL0693]|nr:BrnA antitoxin family protein [Neisseriaceae bacterium ESL0693]
MSMVKYTIDTLPKPSESDIDRLKKLADLPDENIDCSDVPALSAEVWAQSLKLSELYRPQKKQITIRIDADVLDWLKAGGKGYQTKLNEILRHKMMEQKSHQ